MCSVEPWLAQLEAVCGGCRCQHSSVEQFSRPICPLISFIVLFCAARPKLANRDFFISGESYAVSTCL